MSFIVKGIDLPKKADHITLNIYADGTIERVNMTEIIFEKEAQAIQIPTPHGRLIDESEIWFDHSVARSLDDGHNWDELVATKDGICGVPTILESEE